MSDIDIEAIRSAYSRFLAPERILLTGHSHQAWPDAARQAQLQVFDDAAVHVDDKWSRAVFPLVEEVGRGVLARMGFAEDDPIAFGESTHQLAYRLMSALDRSRPVRVLTTTGEFHSLHRQLSRLAESGFEVTWLQAQPRASLADRLLKVLGRERFDMVALSAVFFEDAYVLPRLGEVLARAVERAAVVLVDAYHAFNVVPLDWGPAAAQLYVTTGGYKYAGFGNGICWLRFPRDCSLRPEYTGWFADFGSLEDERGGADRVRYGPGGQRFAGSTFEASAFYRARAALQQWDALGLSVTPLHALYTRQTARIIAQLDAAPIEVELVSPREDARRAGFVTVRVPGAGEVVAALRARGVYVDARGELLRFGPAPYLRDEDIDAGIAAFVEVMKERGHGG